MAHVPMKQLSPPTRQTSAHMRRLSPMVCPLAKLGRSSPELDQHIRNTLGPMEPSVYIHHYPPTYRSSSTTPTNSQNYKLLRNGGSGGFAEPDYRSCNDSPMLRNYLNDGYNREITNYQIPDDFPTRNGISSPSLFHPTIPQRITHQSSCDSLRNSSALRRTSSPTIFQTPSLDTNYKLGRSSPSLDQGYHTLVTPSPGPWTDPNPIFSPYKGKKLHCKNTKTFSNVDILPDNVLVKIFQWLDSSDLCVSARVCKRWETLAWDPQLWKTIKLSGDNICGDKAVRSVLRKLCGQGTTGACSTVEKVFLSDGAKLTDKGLTQLARRCTELTHLQLHGSISVTNNAVFELATKCVNLQHLDLTGCIRVSCLSIAPGLEPPRRLLLQYLDLTDCTAIDDTGLRVIVKNCPQLVYLYLRRCVQVTDTGIKFLPSFCCMLRELSVSDCSRVTDFGLHELARLGSTLRYLSVAKCDQVSDAGLKMIARRCYKLRYLNARGCEAVSDDAITVLARSCPRLRALDIGKCDVSDAGLRALAECCPNLKKLSLRNCDLVTDRGVQCIAYYCRGLQQLNIQDCQISIEGYRAVKKYCKRCIIEHTNPGFC